MFDYLEKFANVCNVLAIKVNLLDALSLGYSNEEIKLRYSNRGILP